MCCTDGVMLEIVCVQADLLWEVCPHLFSRPSPSSPCVSRLVSGIVCMVCCTDGVMLEMVCVQPDLLWEVCPPPFTQLVTIVTVCVTAGVWDRLHGVLYGWRDARDRMRAA